MKKTLLLILIVVTMGIVLFPDTTTASAPESNKKSLIISPSELKIQVGKSQELKVKCTEEKNAMVQERFRIQAL